MRLQVGPFSVVSKVEWPVLREGEGDGLLVLDAAGGRDRPREGASDSGFPFGLGGMKPRHRVIQTQFATEPPIQSLLPLFERLRARAHGQPPEREKLWPGQEPWDGWVGPWS